MTERLQQLFAFLEKAPQDSFTRYSIAYEYMRLGDWSEAEKHFLQLRKDDPDYVGLYYHLGKLYAQQENFEEAIKVYDQGLQTTEKVGDRHAHSELMRARQQALDELEEW